MKYILSSLLTTLTLGMLAITTTVQASTPDGQTPPNEGVCDDLIGGTPGLYGLCVAFCEAQDHASVSFPITEEDLQALEDAIPSGRILANYNKKKQDGDPDMPCIKVEEPCQCWTSQEINDLATGVFGNYECGVYSGSRLGSYIQRDDPDQFVVAQFVDNKYQCLYAAPNVQRAEFITQEQFQECDAQIKQHQEFLPVVCPDVPL